MTNRMITELLFIILLLAEIIFLSGILCITIEVNEKTEYRFTMFALLTICTLGSFFTGIGIAQLFHVLFCSDIDSGKGFEDLIFKKFINVKDNNKNNS